MGRNYKVESDFEYKGYRCVVVFQEDGHRCGYVGVEIGHPLYGKDYGDYLDIKKSDMDGEPIGKRGIMPILSFALDEDDRVRMDCYFDVHGGLTYAGADDEYPRKSNLWWIGFDCAHYNDAKDFDCMEKYFGDNPHTKIRIELEKQYPTDGEVRTKEYVEEECKSLVDQIIKYIEGGKKDV